MPNKNLRQVILTLYREGLSYSEIASRLNCAKSTVSYHVRKIGKGKDKRKIYDWPKVQQYYNEYKSVKLTRQHFGMSESAWFKARTRGDIIPLKPEDILKHKLETCNSRGTIKRCLLSLDILDYVCSVCGIDKWNKEPISLQLDHINGVHDDNRVENLRLLCPNCHSQTSTFSGRNKSYK